MSDPLQALAALPVSEALRAQVHRWLDAARLGELAIDERDALHRLVLQAASGDPAALAELQDAFDGPLPIGTGGRRGPCGPGPNRMNSLVLRETARGLVTAMTAEGVPRRVAVVYDTRRDSRRFGRVVADALVDLGMDVLLVDAPRPTPLLSYMVRTRGCGAGIVISASHNPPGDNGIKVYGPDGAQVLGARDRALMDGILQAIRSPEPVRPTARGSLEIVEGPSLRALDDDYLSYVAAQGVLGDLSGYGLRVVYTPLHGVGHTSVMPVLTARGVQVHMVDAQAPDEGRFATVQSANPELPSAFALAEAEGRRGGADLVVATDPDADRLGALVRDAAGDYVFVDGNRLAVLMLGHVLTHGRPPPDGWVLTTIVTSPLVGTLARAHGVEAIDDLLVGFKHHAGMMAEAPERPVVFATEEAHGYLRGNEIHDKDGAIGALLLTEAAAVAKACGRTLLDDLEDLWRVYGYHRERTANLWARGAAGREAIAALMRAWREVPPVAFAGLAVVSAEDRRRPRHTGSPTRDLPGNVLVYELEAPRGLACRLVVRPSGTEPKAKIYALVRGPAADSTREPSPSHEEIDTLAEAVLADARTQAEAIMAPHLRE